MQLASNTVPFILLLISTPLIQNDLRTKFKANKKH